MYVAITPSYPPNGDVRVTELEVFAGEVKLGACPQTPLAWHYLFRVSFFHTTRDFYVYDLIPLFENFCTRHCVGPRQSPSNRAPHLLRPALLETLHELFFYEVL